LPAFASPGFFEGSAGGITVKDFAVARKIADVVLWRPETGCPLEGTPNKFVQGKK
jgi:4a-hydroxytetrahydrobiopterin dehydratase